MLVLTRKVDESIQIGENIVVTVKAIDGGRVRIGIEAPKDVGVFRTEVAEKRLEAIKQALSGVALAAVMKSRGETRGI